MKRILVATDFSERSDRAVRRATLLAHAHAASITLVRIVDDDQPKRLLRVEKDEATAILAQQARSLREIDGVDCDYRLVLGEPFAAIVQAAREEAADLIVIGPHRRRLLRDVFIGTTAERTIRESTLPVLMANSVPAGAYRHVLVAVDLSECSADALRAVGSLGLNAHAAVSVVHLFDAPARALMSRAALTDDQIADHLAEEETRAESELSHFLRNMAFETVGRVLKVNDGSPAHVIGEAAREISADLVVVGTHGRTGVTKLLLGSVAEAVLRLADRDVLAVPPVRAA